MPTVHIRFTAKEQDVGALMKRAQEPVTAFMRQAPITERYPLEDVPGREDRRGEDHSFGSYCFTSYMK